MVSKIRQVLSNSLAWPLACYQQTQLKHAAGLTVTPETWCRLPAGTRKWFCRKVLKPGDEFAVNAAKENPEINDLIKLQPKGSWAISPAMLYFIWNYLIKHKPKAILEFGSGVSTKMFAAYAKRMQHQGQEISVISIDHDEEWLSETRAGLLSSGLEDRVDLFHAPLANQVIDGVRVVTYEIPETCLSLLEKTQLQLCLIDGPPGTVGRGGTLPLAVPYLADQAAIILDDAFRKQEMLIMSAWHSQWPSQLSPPRLKCIDTHGTGFFNWSSSRELGIG